MIMVSKPAQKFYAGLTEIRGVFSNDMITTAFNTYPIPAHKGSIPIPNFPMVIMLTGILFSNPGLDLFLGHFNGNGLVEIYVHLIISQFSTASSLSSPVPK